jgi:hypothetical protein
MKLQDIETSIKEAQERLQAIRQEEIKELHSRDILIDEISGLQKAKNTLQAEVRQAESEKSFHIRVLESTREQIDKKKELLNIDYSGLDVLTQEEQKLTESIKNKNNLLTEIQHMEEELNTLYIEKKAILADVAHANKQKEKITQEKAKFEAEKEQFHHWKIEQEKYIQKQNEGLIEKENYLSLKERRISKLKNE